MAPLKLLSIEETLDINNPITTSKAVFRLTDGLKLTVTQNEHKKSNVEVAYANDNFNFKYDSGKKSLKGKLEFQQGPARIHLSQKVPNHKWFLLPSPAIKVSTSFLGGRDILYGKWDYQKYKGKLGDELFFGENRALKAYAQLRSDHQLRYGFHAKVQKNFLHSLALDVNSKSGVQYKLESHPTNKLKLKANYAQQKQLMKLEAHYQPTFLNKSMALTFKYDVPVNKKDAETSGKVVIKWLF